MCATPFDVGRGFGCWIELTNPFPIPIPKSGSNPGWLPQTRVGSPRLGSRLTSSGKRAGGRRSGIGVWTQLELGVAHCAGPLWVHFCSPVICSDCRRRAVNPYHGTPLFRKLSFFSTCTAVFVLWERNRIEASVRHIL